MASKKTTTKKRRKKTADTRRKKVARKPVRKKPVRKAPKSKTSTKKTARPAKLAQKHAAKKKARAKNIKRKPIAAPARRARHPSNLLNGPLRELRAYRPKRGESYMSEGQLEHFTEILSTWKRELMGEVDKTMLHMKDDASNLSDPNDRATQESEFGLELRTRDRERKLLKKINAALLRIKERTYGYCEETGEEIGLRRLEARPIATLCLEAQERRELANRQFRDREDYYR